MGWANKLAMATRAVVVGGSLAGLCAGRVLADFFDRVTIVERDAYPDGVADRAGVPHSRQYHYLMLRGRREFARLFDGLDAMLIERGAPMREPGVNVAVLTAFGWNRPRREFRLPGIQPTRALIESSVRELVRKLPRIEIFERTEVTGLIAAKTDGAMRCTGVEIRSRDGAARGPALEADLVVDASGGASRADAWLKKIGLDPPEETVVDGDYGYVSRWYRMRDGAKWPADWWWTHGANLGPRPPEHMIITILTQYEHGRWSLSMAGLNGHYPPDDDAGLAELLPRLRSPAIAEMLKLMEPTSSFYSNRATRNRWRHYERWRDAPRRLHRDWRFRGRVQPDRGAGDERGRAGSQPAPRMHREARRIESATRAAFLCGDSRCSARPMANLGRQRSAPAGHAGRSSAVD